MDRQRNRQASTDVGGEVNSVSDSVRVQNPSAGKQTG